MEREIPVGFPFRFHKIVVFSRNSFFFRVSGLASLGFHLLYLLLRRLLRVFCFRDNLPFKSSNKGCKQREKSVILDNFHNDDGRAKGSLI